MSISIQELISSGKIICSTILYESLDQPSIVQEDQKNHSFIQQMILENQLPLVTLLLKTTRLFYIYINFEKHL